MDKNFKPVFSWINKKGQRTWRKKIDSWRYMLDKVSEKIKEIMRIEKFDDTKIKIDTNNELTDDITLKNVAILMASVIKDDDQFYPKLFLEEALLGA